MKNFAEIALNEYNDEKNIIHQGGVKGQNFWNISSSQFMYVPAFQFPYIPSAKCYEFTATDSNGKTHSFTAEKPTAPLTPIWKDIAVGMVELKIEAIHRINGKRYICGARTFYKSAPFPGREALPKRACSYKECAIKAFEYAYNSPSSQYWLNHAMPDPDYYYNVYPSKTLGSLINAMIAYAELEPKTAKNALKIATNAADYLLSITYGEDTAVNGLPPTYSLANLNEEIVKKNAPAAFERINKVMIIYPASVGSAYLKLEKATGNKKYFEAAQKIAEYFKQNVLPNGSWYLLFSKENNKPDNETYCARFKILDFLDDFYKRTGDECFKTLKENYFNYISKTRYETFDWEAQFEDVPLTSNFSNLSHYDASGYINYMKNNLLADDMGEKAKEIMRFIEDQFVVWGEFAPWSDLFKEGESFWYSPAAMEQYKWYLPIDSSTADVVKAFLNTYKLTGDELLLEKAFALGDSITRRQNPKTGYIPTHWISKNCSEIFYNFWMNCHINSAFTMIELAKQNGEI